ncbi:AraC family transcriptional regulator [Clostridium sp. P21]|uniref:AraC family transcriptional regulator n=1 Tax=Clostridium muellerianum TaxID=2716538 RepID=A0A7Y0EFL7_9CLOT|nr:helix-turn-helix domain-containing protein [Clostridium muellerianum]NMM62604.1 AraC family transcriptional regulator [Clostridium muellerianum]
MFFNDILVKKHLKIKETPNYIYIAPHPLLRKYIAHYTILFPNPKETAKCSDNINDLTLIPDCSGCIIYTYENNDFSLRLWGSTTKTVIVKNDVNFKKIRFFIEFVPGGLHAITGIKQSELCDIQTEVDEVDKYLFCALIHAIENSNDIDDMVSRADMIFLKAVEKNNKQHAVIDSVLKRIKCSNGILQVKELALDEYISERHLNRLFNEYIGINPKMFSRLVRVNHSINIFKKFDYKNCSNIAQVLNYFDQSHFIHDFEQICGVSPNSFFRNMSDFYNEPFKY